MGCLVMERQSTPRWSPPYPFTVSDCHDRYFTKTTASFATVSGVLCTDTLFCSKASWDAWAAMSEMTKHSAAEKNNMLPPLHKI